VRDKLKVEFLPERNPERRKPALTVGKKVRFRHQPDGPDRIISGCNLDGMVSIHGFSGWFAPDLFVEVKND
jgi:uncharacterized protein YodC (DUF2158 family)